MLVLIPTFSFFVYTYIKVGSASNAISSNRQIDRIISGSPDSINVTATTEKATEIVDAIKEVYVIASGGAPLLDTPLEQVKFLEEEIQRLSSELTSRGYAKGTLLDRVVKMDGDNAVEYPAIVKSGVDTYDVFFGFNNDSITPPVEKALLDLFNEPDVTKLRFVQLIGYTDRSGNPEYNCKLAIRRLHEVSEFISKHFPFLRITSIPAGETGVPFSSEIDGLREPRNRVVRISMHAIENRQVHMRCKTEL
jgi:hypothetical protein